jgi:hypothetical protein
LPPILAARHLLDMTTFAPVILAGLRPRHVIEMSVRGQQQLGVGHLKTQFLDACFDRRHRFRQAAIDQDVALRRGDQ